jgi:hypothetical protein
MCLSEDRNERPSGMPSSVDAAADPPQPGYLRVFEIARPSEIDAGISFFEVDLPNAWARSHERAEVSLRKSEDFGWEAKLVGDGNEHLIAFPLYDHVDQMLLDSDSDRELPPDLASGAWSDLDQGWWASILVDGTDVYIAEADLDALLDVEDPAELALVRPGVVSVGRVDLLWNCVPRVVYEAAWGRAVERFQHTSD